MWWARQKLEAHASNKLRQAGRRIPTASPLVWAKTQEFFCVSFFWLIGTSVFKAQSLLIYFTPDRYVHGRSDRGPKWFNPAPLVFLGYDSVTKHLYDNFVLCNVSVTLSNSIL